MFSSLYNTYIISFNSQNTEILLPPGARKMAGTAERE